MNDTAEERGWDDENQNVGIGLVARVRKSRWDCVEQARRRTRDGRKAEGEEEKQQQKRKKKRREEKKKKRKQRAR